jgi:hypothetical protein
VRKKLKYGTHTYADGGRVELYEKPKLKPHVPPRVEDPIAPQGPPGGDQTPGAKGTYPMPGSKKKKKKKGK